MERTQRNASGVVRRLNARARWTALVLVAAVGCRAATHEPHVREPGIVHEVHPGENLYRIAKAYGISPRALARINDLATPDRIDVGQRLFIPGGKQVLPVNVITPKQVLSDAPTPRDFPKDNIARNPIYFLPGPPPAQETAQRVKDKPT